MADRISELPDLILHGILRRLPSQEQAAQTTAISRRWRNLWRSYTVVDFYYCRGNFHKFAEASIERFTRDSLLRMEFLRFWIAGGDEDNFARTWPLVEKLFVLALERKAEEIVIKIMRTYTGDYYYTPHFCLPYRSLSNSAVKILQLEGIKLRCGNDYNLLLPLHFLQSLHMYDVELDDERLLESLIASSPLLENLQLHAITNLNKIEVSNVANLRTLGIMYCDELTEIKIAAPLLHTLRLELISEKCKIELSTPQLHFLEMMDEFVLGASDFVAVLSKLQSVKSLILNGGFPQEDRMLRFSIPNLEELTLINPYGLSEIDIDTGLGLKKFSLKYEVSCPNELVKCNINHAACCLWELHIGSHVGTSLNNPQQWFVDLKNFMVRFPQFQTIYIIQSNFYMVTFDHKEEGDVVRPTAIRHLIITARLVLGGDYHVILDGLLWAYHPKFISFECSFSSMVLELFPLQYLSTENSKKGVKEQWMWQHQLKDAKIATKEEIEEEFKSISKDMISLLKDPNRVWLTLTWY